MKTTYALLLALAFAMSGAMLSASGYSDLIGEDKHNQKLSEKTETTANNSAVTQDDLGGGLTGMFALTLMSFGFVFDMVKFALLLPLELRSIGMPSWAAVPFGMAIQIVMSFGILQFARGAIYR